MVDVLSYPHNLEVYATNLERMFNNGINLKPDSLPGLVHSDEAYNHSPASFPSHRAVHRAIKAVMPQANISQVSSRLFGFLLLMSVYSKVFINVAHHAQIPPLLFTPPEGLMTQHSPFFPRGGADICQRAQRVLGERFPAFYRELVTFVARHGGRA